MYLALSCRKKCVRGNVLDIFLVLSATLFFYLTLSISRDGDSGDDGDGDDNDDDDSDNG